ncbi:MAG: anthranilate synthase component II [Culicoidibacterales bacterium]
MIVMIDNYDSFTYNLVDYLHQLGAEVQVFRHDGITLAELEALNPTLIVLSPGPKSPTEAGICLAIVRKFATKFPILGVCLGHQSIAQAFGANIIKAPEPVHGKVSEISHTQIGMFQNLPHPLTVARYHSLIVEPQTLPEQFKVLAQTIDGLIMAFEHQEYPLQGVQFHPESVATQAGLPLLANAYQKAQLFKEGYEWSLLNGHMSKLNQNS